MPLAPLVVPDVFRSSVIVRVVTQATMHQRDAVKNCVSTNLHHPKRKMDTGQGDILREHKGGRVFHRFYSIFF